MKIVEQSLVHFAFKGGKLKKIGLEITSGEFFEIKWFYMKYIGKYLKAERLLKKKKSIYM